MALSSRVVFALVLVVVLLAIATMLSGHTNNSVKVAKVLQKLGYTVQKISPLERQREYQKFYCSEVHPIRLEDDTSSHKLSVKTANGTEQIEMALFDKVAFSLPRILTLLRTISCQETSFTAEDGR